MTSMSLLLLAGFVVAQANNEQATTQEWKRYNFGTSGISYSLPVAPEEFRENLTTWRYDVKYKNLEIVVRTQKLEEGASLDAAKKYEDYYNPLREKYGKKVRQVENFSEIVGAELFGVDNSMGFVMDVLDGSKQIVFAWQVFQDQGWQYETTFTAPANQANELFQVFESFNFVDPQTKQPKIGKIGETGLSSMYGGGFVEKELNPSAEEISLYSEIRQYDLQSPKLPIIATAQSVTFREDGEINIENYVARMQSAVSAVMRNGKLEPKLEAATVDGKPGHRLTGTITDGRLTIQVEGRIVTSGKRLWSYIVFLPTQDAAVTKASNELIGSLKITP